MGRLSIDEVIVREKRIHEENQKVVDTHVLHEEFTLEELYCDDTEVIEEHLNNYKFASEYHKQLAGWLEELKSYEDLEAQGLLLRLPCKVGSTVYLIFEKRIYEGTGVKIVSVRTPSHDYTRIEIVFEIEDPWYSDGRKMKHGANEILGEKVFLTREEAEQALAEMQKG